MTCVPFRVILSDLVKPRSHQIQRHNATQEKARRRALYCVL